MINPCRTSLDRSIFRVCISLLLPLCIIAGIWCAFPARTRWRRASVPTSSSVAATRAVPPPHGISHWLTIPFKVPASWALRIADAKSVISSPTSLWWIRDCLLSYTYSIGSSMVKLRNPPVFYKRRDCDRRNDRNDYQYDHQLRQSKSFFLCVFHLYSSFIRCFRHLCITFYYMISPIFRQRTLTKNPPILP